jgi:hypothetical protein
LISRRAIAEALAPRALARGALAFAKRELTPRALVLRLFTFFAAPTDGSGAAIFRIGYGFLAASVALWTGLNAERWFANTGVVVARGGAVRSSLYRIGSDLPWMPTLHVALLSVGALLLLVGLFPRIGAILVFVAHTSLQHRTPAILNSGDRLFSILALLSLTLPLDKRLSFHAWHRRRRGVPPPHASMWGMRLVQIQIAYVYAATVLSKLHNARWLNGKALRDVLASPVFAEWPAWIDFWPVIYAMTWGTLVFEIGFPSLVWFRKLRPWLLLAGIGFHMGIDILMIIPMFSYVMIVGYAAFLDDDIANRLLARIGLGRAESREAPPTLRSAEDTPAPAVIEPAAEPAEVANDQEPKPPAPRDEPVGSECGGVHTEPAEKTEV